jgi:hypothetical protein
MRNSMASPIQQSSSLPRGISAPTNEAMTIQSQQYNIFIRNGGNSIRIRAFSEVKGSSPTTGLNLLWAWTLYKENSNYWQVSQEEAGRFIP